MKKKHIIAIIITASIGVIATGGVAFGMKYHYDEQMAIQQQSFEAQISQLNAEISSVQKTALVPISDIKWGAEIKEDMVEEKNIYSDLDSSAYMTADQIGSIAKVDLKAGTPIYADSVAEETHEGTREIEVNYVNLNTNLIENDTVDIRVKFPNGEDYVVCSKQTLRNLNLASANLFLWVTEDELLCLDSAVVDASINGGKLYVTHYVEPTLQTESVTNYQPNIDVLNLIAQDPNIVDISKRNLSATVRSEMEERLDAFFEEHPDLDSEESDPNSATAVGVASTNTGSTASTSTSSTTTSGNEYTEDYNSSAVTVQDQQTEAPQTSTEATVTTVDTSGTAAGTTTGTDAGSTASTDTGTTAGTDTGTTAGTDASVVTVE